MIKTKKGLLAVFVLLISVILSSCGMLAGITRNGDLYGWIDGESMNVSELPSPKTHTLVYGGMLWEVDNKLYNFLEQGSPYGFYTEYVQLNTKKEAIFVEPVSVGKSMCFLPMVPQNYIKAVRTTRLASVNTQYYLGLQNQFDSGISFITSKPGLQHIGGYIMNTDDFCKTRKDPNYKEIDTLRDMQVLFSGAPEWLDLIEQRIVELGYPKEVENEDE